MKFDVAQLAHAACASSPIVTCCVNTTSSLSTSGTYHTFSPWYHENMKNKKPTKNVRISLRSYELLRRIAFKAHKPIVDILDEFVSKKA